MMKARIEKSVKLMAVLMNIFVSDRSNTVSALTPDTSSMIQVESNCFRLLAALMSDKRYSDAQMYLIVFCFLFQLSMYSVDQIASMTMYGKFSIVSTLS